MALEPLDTPFDESVDHLVSVKIDDGLVWITDEKYGHQQVVLSEDALGKFFDKWMIARLHMNQRKSGNDIF